MRLHIEHLSSQSIEWGELSPGVYMKMLNHNESTGERTALFRFRPDEGANPPNVCHYHSVSEEIFVLDGRMTFDHKTWLGKYGYVYHPPFAVHGFNSAVPEETTFIGRSPSDLDFNYPDVQDKTESFFIDGKTSNRAVTYLNPTSEKNWKVIQGHSDDPIGKQFILSEDTETGERSSLIHYNQGVSVSARPDGYETYNEGFILNGSIESADGTAWRVGDYWHRLPGKPVPDLTIKEPTLLYSCTGPAFP